MEKDPELFRLARVSMGLLGAVTEVTLQARAVTAPLPPPRSLLACRPAAA